MPAASTVEAASHKQPSVAWLYLASAGFSLLGNGVAAVVWPWLVLQRTGDPAAAGVVATAIAVPSLIFALIGGQLIDTFGRKRMSIISDVISGASVLAVIAVDSWWGLHLGWFIAIGIVGAVGDIPGMAARAALGGDVAYTSGRSLDFISGINQTLVGLAYLVGPALAGLLMSALPIQQVLWITGGCSLVAALLTCFLRVRTNPVEQPEAQQLTGWKNWANAWGIILRQPVIQLLALVALVSAALIAPYLMLVLPAHFQALNAPDTLGYVVSSYAVGMIIGGSIIAAVGTSFRRTIWVVSMIVSTIGFSCMVWLDNTWVLVCGTGIAGIGGGLSGPLQMVLVTEQIPENLRGRAFSVFNAIGQFAAPIGLVAATVALTHTSIQTIAFGGAVIWAVAASYFVIRGVLVMPAPATGAPNDVQGAQPPTYYDEQNEQSPAQ